MRDCELHPSAHFSFLSRNKCRWSPKKVMTAVVRSEAIGDFTVASAWTMDALVPLIRRFRDSHGRV